MMTGTFVDALPLVATMWVVPDGPTECTTPRLVTVASFWSADRNVTAAPAKRSCLASKTATATCSESFWSMRIVSGVTTTFAAVGPLPGSVVELHATTRAIAAHERRRRVEACTENSWRGRALGGGRAGRAVSLTLDNAGGGARLALGAVTVNSASGRLAQS